MSLASSGQISINEIYTELGEDGPLNWSLKEASDGTVATINTDNASGDRPDGLPPHAMTEFYSYDHDFVSTGFSGWSSSGQSIGSNPGGTSYYNKSIPFVGFTNDVIDVYYTLNSGVVRGTLSVATSTSAFPNNSATYRTVSSSTGNFGTAVSINGSGTLYCRFKYVQHHALHETSTRTIRIVAEGETSPGLSQSNFDNSGGGFP